MGQEFYGEYLAKTDPLGADVPNPVSHVAYGYATQMCILDRETGRVKKMVAAHDVGKAVNPLSCEGQIEGGVVMSLGYALTEQYPIDENCKPTAKYGMLGLFRANQIPPEIQAIVVEKPGLNVAGGAIGIGEITSIPTAPAIADAYFRLDGQRRRGYDVTIDNIYAYIQDVAGIRVICNYLDDIYYLRSLLTRSESFKVLREVDYIQQPKESGYRSLHLIIDVPIVISEGTLHLPVEIQLRTIAMDMWASLEHELRYKSDRNFSDSDAARLRLCSEAISEIDREMQDIYQGKEPSYHE